MTLCLCSLAEQEHDDAGWKRCMTSLAHRFWVCVLNNGELSPLQAEVCHLSGMKLLLHHATQLFCGSDSMSEAVDSLHSLLLHETPSSVLYYAS